MQRCVAAVPPSGSLVVFDVGANRGQWSSQFLSFYGEFQWQPDLLTLHAFEPAPGSRLAYKNTVAKNLGWERVQLHSYALSDEPGESQFAIWAETAGTNTLRFDPESERQPEEIITVQLRALDELAFELGVERIDLLKIDTEGNDLFVLRGATGLFESERIGVAQFEYNHRWIDARSYLKDVFELVGHLPYQIGRIMDGRIDVIRDWHPELERYFEANYVIIHDRSLDLFDIEFGEIGPGNVYRRVWPA